MFQIPTSSVKITKMFGVLDWARAPRGCHTGRQAHTATA
jgi:hypothetical protein